MEELPPNLGHKPVIKINNGDIIRYAFIRPPLRLSVFNKLFALHMRKKQPLVLLFPVWHSLETLPSLHPSLKFS